MEVLREHSLPLGRRLQLVHGDITLASVDALINAANAQLQHVGGVAGAIARRGGLAIQTESDTWVRKHGPISHDAPALTSGGKLLSRYVIHVVGPIWGEGDEDHKLYSAVQGALQMADKCGIKSVALPAISTGIYGFPKARAAHVILDVIFAYFEEQLDSKLRSVEIMLMDQQSVTAFVDELDSRRGVVR